MSPRNMVLRGAGAWSATAPLCALIGQTGRATELIKVQLARDGPGPWRGPRGPGPALPAGLETDITSTTDCTNLV
jgi:hypothetical protein